MQSNKNIYLSSDSESIKLYNRATQFMPGGNSRAAVYIPPHPPFAAYGKGCIFVDVEGVERIDFHNNHTTLILGHCNPKVIQAISEQLSKGFCFGLPGEQEIELSSILCERVPSIEKVRYSNSGTEAVMTAVKGARAFTGKPNIAKFESAFHGAYDFVQVSLHPNLLHAGPRRAPYPVPYGKGNVNTILQHVLILPWNDAEASCELIRKNKDTLAAVILDPMPNYSGLIPPRPGFLEAVREVTAESDILLIFDEVLNFRLGYGGAQSRFGVIPDMTTLGKIIGGGLPVGAIGGRSDVMDVFNPVMGEPKVYHSGTTSANPISMVAGTATMLQLTPEVFQKLDQMGDYLRAEATKIIERLGFPGQVTGLASNFRIHMTHTELYDYRSSLLDEKQTRMRDALWFCLMDRGVIVVPSGMGCLSTPMQNHDLDGFLEALEDSLVVIKTRFL